MPEPLKAKCIVSWHQACPAQSVLKTPRMAALRLPLMPFGPPTVRIISYPSPKLVAQRSFQPPGNEDAHIILRGGNNQPNYDAIHVEKVAEGLAKANLPQNIMIDFSHDNSLKQCQRQLLVGEDVGEQIANGDQRIIGA